jgi:glycine betaine/proline transport system permease protein
MINLHIGEGVEIVIDWLTNNFGPLFDLIATVLTAIITAFEAGLDFIPAIVMMILLALAAWRLAGRGVAIFTLVGLFVVDSMGLWAQTMSTLALVIGSTLVALVIGLPVGIWSARSETAAKIVRPVLDFMQTMPAFVYLIPAVYFFQLGKVPGMIATVIFAMPPAVRLTSLGIRQVQQDVVEAAQAFGATPRQVLVKVQLPLALPTILAGVNQTIMLALSMVVIAAMIGAGGLGQEVLKGLTQLKVGLGFEGGLAIVILAIVLDRITQALGASSNK